MASNDLPERLARKITGSREAFADAFLRAQRDLAPSAVRDFKVVATSADDLPAFTDAFRHAEGGGWLRPLLEECFYARLVSIDILDELAKPGPKAGARTPGAAGGKTNGDGPDQQARRRARQSLQAVVNLSRGFNEPGIFASRMFRLASQTCLVYVDNTPVGTGLLIGPRYVLTAWHVLQTAFDAADVPLPNFDKRIHVEFGRMAWDDDDTLRTPVESVHVASPWHLKHSRCHPSELQDELPSDLAELAPYLDYAVIQLEREPKRGRIWRTLNDRGSLKPDLPILLFQHPKGWNLQYDEAKVAEMLAAPRFFHRVNTLDGSSGAPCVDREFKLVGIHQAGYRPDANLPEADRRNRGVPIDAVAKDVGTLPELDPTASLLWQMDDEPPGPVIGRTEFQTWVLDSIERRGPQPNPPRILAVSGGSMSGKTFCLRLLRRLLSSTDDIVVECPAGSLPATPEALIELVLLKCGEKRNAQSTPLVPQSESNTTEPAWIKNRMVPEFTSRVGALAAGRRVWLAIDQLDAHTIPGGPMRDFLAGLYEAVGSVSWLRFALLGFRGTMPGKALPYFREHRLIDPTVDEVEAYLEQRYLAARMSPQNLRPMAGMLVTASDNAVNAASAQNAELTRVVALTSMITGAMKDFLPALPSPTAQR